MIYPDYIPLKWSTSGRNGYVVPHYSRRRSQIILMGADLYDESKHYCGYWSHRQMAKPLIERLVRAIRWGVEQKG